MQKTMDYYVSNFIIFLLMILIFGFNDVIKLIYPYKIVFIILMSLRLLIKPIKISSFLIWTFAFSLYSLASILWADSQSTAIFYFTWSIQAFIIALLIESFLDNEIKIRDIMNFIILGGFIAAIRAIFAIPFELWGSERIGIAIGYNANELAIKMAVALIFSVYFIGMEKNKYIKYIYIVALAILGLGIVLTGSKQGIILAVGASVLFILLDSKNKKETIRRIIFTVFGLIILYYLIFNVDIFYKLLGIRFETMFGLNQYGRIDGSTINRLHSINVGLELFKGKPLIGYGIGNFSYSSGIGGYSHNNYIELLVGLGITGLIIYYSMYINLLYKFFRNHIMDSQIRLLGSVLLIILFIETALVSFQNDTILLFLAICSSSLSITLKRHRCIKNTKVRRFSKPRTKPW